jgi:hypothetical protein
VAFSPYTGNDRSRSDHVRVSNVVLARRSRPSCAGDPLGAAGVVAGGFVLMASVYGELAWSGIAVLVGIDTPTGGGVEAAAQFLAELTISLWLCSAVIVLGVVVHAIVLIVRLRSPAA